MLSSKEYSEIKAMPRSRLISDDLVPTTKEDRHISPVEFMVMWIGMSIVPAGNVNLGIVVYAIGMMLFTMIMGNAFAAITVMTVGIGAPLVLAYGANPVVIGMLALTCGYCGTLLTPMAANFNIVPVAILEMKDKFGVIKNQVIPSFILITFQIILMIILK